MLWRLSGEADPPAARPLDRLRSAGDRHLIDRRLVLGCNLVPMPRRRSSARAFGRSYLGLRCCRCSMPRDAEAMARALGLCRLFRGLSRVVDDDKADERSELDARCRPQRHRDDRRRSPCGQ